jgi:hypothetical protein
VKTVLALALVGFMSAPVVCAQAELTGKWQGETRNGSRVLLDLTVAKGEVTGTLTRNDETSPITEGKSSNNTFSFKATLGGQQEAISGELGDDQVTVWLDRQGREGAIVLKRVKK